MAESDVLRRQILTSKDGPRNERVKTLDKVAIIYNSLRLSLL